MRPFIITDQVRKRVREVLAHASANPFDADAMRHLIELHEALGDSAPAVGDDPRFVVKIPVGFRCVFTIEEQPEPLAWCRHVSMSIEAPRRLPHPVVAGEIAALFGFRSKQPEVHYIERDRILHFIEPLVEPVDFLKPLREMIEEVKP